MVQSGVKIFKLSFGGLVPIKTVWEGDNIFKMIALFADPNEPDKQPLDAIIDKLINCKSIEEIKQKLLGYHTHFV